MAKLSRRQMTNLKIAAATATCIFALATAFTSTIAWFSTSRMVEANGMSITVSLINADVQGMTVHRCNLSASTSATLKFYEEPSVVVSGHGVVQTASGIEMDEYSTLNQTQPVLLLFTFNEGIIDSDINITATSNSSNFVSAATNENINSFPFSSTVSFKCASYTSNTFPFSSVSLGDYGNDYSFVSFEKDQEGAIVSYSFDNGLNLYSGSSNSSIKYIAIILDYYADAVDYIVQHTAASVFIDHDNCINFFCDWVLSL